MRNISLSKLSNLCFANFWHITCKNMHFYVLFTQNVIIWLCHEVLSRVLLCRPYVWYPCYLRLANVTPSVVSLVLCTYFLSVNSM